MATAFIFLSTKPEKVYYNELYRPQFHFSPEKNWNNDPNGLVYYKGEYHLFYQYNPDSTVWGNMHWGHAVSKDLVHWEHLPVALFPDEGGDGDENACTVFSGSAIVDKNNLLGVKKGSEETLVAFYTSYRCGQRIAFSTDKGRTWEKYAGNPVIPFDPDDDARDPKVFWYEPTQKWVMVLYRKLDNDVKKQGVSIYNSDNLTDWEFKSHIPGFYECPDLVELKVNNRPNEKKWVLFNGDGSYLVGLFNGETFTPETAKMKSDFGSNYYATQTWSNIPENDGRTIQIAWMQGNKFPDMPFNGQMTFPCELSLKTSGENIFLVRRPVKEIGVLYDKHYTWAGYNVIPGINDNILKKVKSDCVHLSGTFDLKTVDNFGFMIRHGKKVPGTEVLYNVKRGTLSCLGVTVPLMPAGNKLSFEILVDRASIEIFANNGQMVMSFGINAPAENREMVLFSNGGELIIDQLDVYELKSAWREE